MTSLAKFVQRGLAAVVLILLVAQPSVGKVIPRSDSTQSSQDLFLLGFGELTNHVLDVSGNTEAFELANPTLGDGYSNNYRFSLFANGAAGRGFTINGAAVVDSRIGEEYQTVDPNEFRLKMSVESTEPLWDSWRFTGKGVYDPNRLWELENLDKRLLTQPQEPSRLELLMRLESDEHGIIEGGSIRPSFKDAKFSLHQRSIFGAYADLHTERVGVEAVAGKLEGKSYREGSAVGIRADGTSGPFDLAHAPITRGSEEVKIQVRDRFDESTVLETRTLIRDIDYTVDYLRGRVLLHRPEASETISSDPVYIVITFDYLREADDDIMGGRARVMPTDNTRVSGTYLHRNLDNAAVGDGVDEPENLMSADGAFKISDHTSGYAEVAGTENPNDADDYSAVRLGAGTEVIEDLSLRMDFQRIDDQFRSFTNSDLNPTKNQQRMKFGGDYDITTSQKASASYTDIRGLEANGDYNTYAGKRNEKILALGYRNNLMKEFGFGVRFERRSVEDLDDANHEDNNQNRAVLDVGGRLDDVSLLGEFGYKASYERVMFRNDALLGDHDANTNQIAIGLTSRPSERASIEVSQRFALRSDLEDDLYVERQDVSVASVQLRLHENVNTLTTAEYKRYTAPGNSVQFWQDDPLRTQWARTFAIEYLPLKKIKALGKYGRQQTQQWFTDSTTRATTDFALGQVTYFYTHHLSFDAETEYRRSERHFDELSRNKTWDLGLRVNWNRDRLNEFTAGVIRRWQLFDYPPSDEITSSSYIVLVSGGLSFARDFFARGSIKSILLNEPLDDERTFTKVEVGYDSRSWYRASLGYERIGSDVGLQPDLNYTGQGVFIRLTGKM
jgi:hypothetical protein